jgi:hypothetical protein
VIRPLKREAPSCRPAIAAALAREDLTGGEGLIAFSLASSLRAETGSRTGTVRRVAEQLGYGVESVRALVKQAEIDDGLRTRTV